MGAALKYDDLGLGSDAFGHTVQVNNGITQYSNHTDANGLIISINDLHNSQTLTNDVRGRVIQRSFDSGRVITYTYDNFDRVTAISDNAGPSVSMVYDAMGNKLSQTVTPLNGGTPQTTLLQYDVRDRLTQITDPKGQVKRFDYNIISVGCHVLDKITSVTDTAGRVENRNYDNRQRLTRVTDADNHVTRYEYNSRGDRIAQTDASGNRSTFSFDPLGRRVAKAIAKADGSSFVQSYLHIGDQNQILMGTAGGGTTTLYLDDREVDQHVAEISAQGVKAYVTNHLGSVLNSRASGAVATLAAFGERIDTTPISIASNAPAVDYGFTGQQYEPESGTYYYRARQYDSTTGRFLSEDPIGFGGGDENLYRYVLNNPQLYTDPTGEAFQAAPAVFLGIIVLGTAYVIYNNRDALKRWGQQLEDQLKSVKSWLGIEQSNNDGAGSRAGTVATGGSGGGSRGPASSSGGGGSGSGGSCTTAPQNESQWSGSGGDSSAVYGGNGDLIWSAPNYSGPSTL